MENPPATEISILAYVLAQLDSTPLTYKEVEDGSGVPKRTVEKIARRETENPGVSHIEKLATFFRSLEAAAGARLPQQASAAGTR